MSSSGTHDVTCIPDLEYLHLPGGSRRLDLYVPEGAERPPVVLYLHGGAWVLGSRKDHQQRLQRLSSAGLAVASIEYRLAHEAAFPAQREDVAAAIDTLRRVGAQWGLDVGSVGLWGASAGAHLAALIALTLSESSDVDVFALAGLFGRYDLTEAGLISVPDPDLRPPDEIIRAVWPPALFGRPASPMKVRALLADVDEAHLDEAALRAISPVAHLDHGDFPVLLLHGTSDAVTHHAHSERFARAATSSGRSAELMLVDGANHEDPWFDGPEAASKLAAFFLRNAPHPARDRIGVSAGAKL